jgi:hypothetical protein
VSLSSMVSRGVVGRLRERPSSRAASIDQQRATTFSVRLPGASMRLLEAGLAGSAVAAAILIGLGR